MPTSDPHDAGVFVHARFPDGTSRSSGVGQARGARMGEFAYAGSWLRDEGGIAFPLDPQNLPFQRAAFAERRRSWRRHFPDWGVDGETIRRLAPAFSRVAAA